MTVSLQHTPPEDVLEIMTSRSDSLLEKMYSAKGLSLFSRKIINFTVDLLGIFGQLHRVNELYGIEGVVNVHDRQNWTKNFLLHDWVRRLYVHENRRLDVLVVCICFAANSDIPVLQKGRYASGNEKLLKCALRHAASTCAIFYIDLDANCQSKNCHQNSKLTGNSPD